MTGTVETFFSTADSCWMNRVPGQSMQLPNRYPTASLAAVRGQDLARFLHLEHTVVADRGGQTSSMRALSYVVAAEQRRWETGGAHTRVPHGTAHLLDTGSGATLCGRSAADLEVFAGVPVTGDYMAQHGCADCRSMADLDRES